MDEWLEYLDKCKNRGWYFEIEPEESERLAADIRNALTRIEQLEAALRDVIDAWDWWQVDTYDRCGSVPDDAIRNARAALGEKKDD